MQIARKGHSKTCLCCRMLMGCTFLAAQATMQGKPRRKEMCVCVVWGVVDGGQAVQLTSKVTTARIVAPTLEYIS